MYAVCFVYFICTIQLSLPAKNAWFPLRMLKHIHLFPAWHGYYNFFNGSYHNSATNKTSTTSPTTSHNLPSNPGTSLSNRPTLTLFTKTKPTTTHITSTASHASNPWGTPNTTGKSGTKSDTVTIVAVSLGSCLMVVIVGVAIFCCCKIKRRRTRARKVEEFRRSHEANSKNAEAGDGKVCNIEMEWTHMHKTRYTNLPKPMGAIDDWELPRHRLVVYTDAKLGSGAFGSVYKGKILGLAPAWKHYSQTEMPKHRVEDVCVAVKSLPEYADEGAKSDFLQEINFMKSLGYNDHVVCLLGCITIDQPLCLLVELCSDGDLLHFLRKHNQKRLGVSKHVFSQRDLLSFAWQVCDGMVYLSSKGYIHRDLAARNVLVHYSKTAKIGDFGLCRHVGGDIYTTRGGRLPIKWMALESLELYEYTTKSDVWSFGVVLFEIFTMGGVPFPLIQPADMVTHLNSGNRLEQPEECPDSVYHIMQRCWESSPLNRPTFAELAEQLRQVLTGATEQYGYLEVHERSRGLSNVSSESVELEGDGTNAGEKTEDTS